MDGYSDDIETFELNQLVNDDEDGRDDSDDEPAAEILRDSDRNVLGVVLFDPEETLRSEVLS